MAAPLANSMLFPVQVKDSVAGKRGAVPNQAQVCRVLVCLHLAMSIPETCRLVHLEDHCSTSHLHTCAHSVSWASRVL